MKGKKKISSTEQLKKLRKGSLREKRKEDGYFDGRFRQRVVKSKKAYKRKKWRDGEDEA